MHSVDPCESLERKNRGTTFVNEEHLRTLMCPGPKDSETVFVFSESRF
jgi:hypothetical protein